jgi:adenosylcobyric acid synthase
MVQSLAVLGTGSDVGKTVITAGICRILHNHGIKVAPFKAQNMSNNAEPALISSTFHINQNHDQSETDNQTEDECTENLKCNNNINSSSNNPDNNSCENTSSCSNWGEIGSAQAMQAEACRILPRVEMNPILLKSGGRRKSDGAYLCNVVVLGKSLIVEDYGQLGKRTNTLMSLVLRAHQQLAHITSSEVIVLEGAGSCTELNLLERDVVNLPLVRKLNCSWILVANIDPGGVFAQIVGTKACVTEQDWDLCIGVIVNRLRGEAKYFEPGPAMLEKMVGKPIFVVPYLYDLNLPEEDGLGVERRLAKEKQLATGCINNSKVNDKQKKHKVVIIAYPHIAITSDLTPVENDNQFCVEWRRNEIPSESFPDISAIILPGSRLTRSDLEWMIDATEWISYLQTFVKNGGKVLGLCGGYQMLGISVADLNGVEGHAGESKGLGFLPIETQIEPVSCKIVTPRRGVLFETNTVVDGFELHCGRTRPCNEDSKSNHIETKPLIRFTDRYLNGAETDGMQCGNISGTYLHGLLKTRALRRKLLLPTTSNLNQDFCSEGPINAADDETNDDPLDRFAHHLESCGLTVEAITNMIK